MLFTNGANLQVIVIGGGDGNVVKRQVTQEIEIIFTIFVFSNSCTASMSDVCRSHNLRHQSPN